MEFDPGLAEYPCTNCTERLGSVYIECAVCEDIRLCLECFSCGAEFSKHERIHDYKVKNTRGKIIFHDESSERDPLYSSDEMTLLEAVERFNLGNWDDVAAHVSNPMWTPKDLRDHYDRYYLHGKIVKATKLNLKPPLIKDHCNEEITDTCNKDIISKVNVDDLTMIAYMPNRDDFEKLQRLDLKLSPMKHWEQAFSRTFLDVFRTDLDELLIFWMFLPLEPIKSVKVAHIDSYIRQLVERKRRHDVIHDYDLITQFFKQEKPQPYSSARYTVQANIKRKRERELREGLKKFAQLLPAEEFSDLIDSIVREKFLKDRIEQLQDMRKKGVTTLGSRGKSFQPDVAVKRLRMIICNDLKQCVQTRERGNYDSALEHQEALENGNTCAVGTKNSRPKIAVAPPTPSEPEATRQNKKCKFDDSNRTIIQCLNDYRTFSSSDESDINFYLSNSEKTTCQLYNIAPEDYKLLKMDLLIDSTRRRRPWMSLSAENRVEIDDNCLRMRNCVQNFMSECGWLS